jgi:NADH-quinone oxidoreductase subunit J
LGALIALEMAAVLMGGFRATEAPSAVLAVGQVAAPVSNAKALGILLYTDYLMPIQIGAVILLVAMITAIALTLRERKDSKAINASIQVRVRAADRLSIVKVGVTQAGAAPQPPAPEAAPQENK